MKQILFTVAVLITVSGFAQVQVKNPGGTTKIIMYENPEFVNHEFNKVLILTGVADADFKWDQKIMKEFEGLQLKISSAMSLFPPLKEYTPEDIKKICEANKADGLITVQQTKDGKYNGYESKAGFTLTLLDVATGLRAVYFTGTSTSLGFNDEKNKQKFIRVLLPDLKRIMTP